MKFYGHAETLTSIMNEHTFSSYDFGVNWGSSRDNGSKHIFINKNIMLDKHESLVILNRHVQTPKVYSERELMQAFRKEPRNQVAVCVIGRSSKHSRGCDMDGNIIRNESDFHRYYNPKHTHYVNYIDKVREFRVHVLGDDCYVYEKIPCETGSRDKVSWCWDNGFKFEKYSGNPSLGRELETMARKSVRALHYDFGAVDICADNCYYLYVLEVNSAPRLGYKMRCHYADFFIEREREHRRKRNVIEGLKVKLIALLYSPLFV